jgi:hypothetical protein
MSEGWKDGRFELFKCPLCGDGRYVEVRVQRPSGIWYVTPFLQCVGCTVMFRDPVSFSGMCIRSESKTSDMRLLGSTYGVMPAAQKGDTQEP